MKQQEAETLAHANRFDIAVIQKDPEGRGWEIFLYGENYQGVSRSSDGVETARGGLRTWSSLDTAHKWIRGLPTQVKIRIEVDG